MPSPLRVLIVEDDPADAEIVTRKLARMPTLVAHVLAVAAGRRDGQKMLADHPADVLLLDLKLPNGSGLDVLRAMQEVPSVVVPIVLTGVARPGEEIAAMREGAQGFILKDCTPEELETEIERALARHEFAMRMAEASRDLHPRRGDGG